MEEELLALLDLWLDRTSHRDHFSVDEIRDMILDARSIVTRIEEPVAVTT